MADKVNVDRLVEDLQFVKTAITKSNHIFKYVKISKALGLVGLWIGLGITMLAGLAYGLINRFGSFAQVPSASRIVLYSAMTVLFVATAVGKIVLVLRSARQTYQDITLIRMIEEIYRPQTLNIIIPFVMTITGITVFLTSNGLHVYLVPVLSVLFGLMFIAFLNVFYFSEMLVAGDWLIITGLITLFNAQTLHPLLALIITFGLGFPMLYVANRVMDK